MTHGLSIACKPENITHITLEPAWVSIYIYQTDILGTAVFRTLKKVPRQSIVALCERISDEFSCVNDQYMVRFTQKMKNYVRTAQCIFSISINYRSKTCNNISVISLLIKKRNISNTQVRTVAADHVSDRPPYKEHVWFY